MKTKEYVVLPKGADSETVNCITEQRIAEYLFNKREIGVTFTLNLKGDPNGIWYYGFPDEDFEWVKEQLELVELVNFIKLISNNV